METKNPIAFITGATSGIGKEFACRLAASGYDLIITGRRAMELRKVANVISSEYHVGVEVMIGDLTNVQYCQKLCTRIKMAENIQVLVNNAGFGIENAFHRIDIEDIRSMIYTHMIAAVELIHAVLPGMMQRRSGTIINVSSLAAFTPGFARSIYLGTKGFIHYFTEGLYPEIKEFGIHLQSLCPGMTVSDFHRNIHDENIRKRMHQLPFMSPEEVVTASFKALKTGKILCIPGVWNKLIYILAKLLPPRILMQISGIGKKQTPVIPEEIRVVELQKSGSITYALRHAN